MYDSWIEKWVAIVMAILLTSLTAFIMILFGCFLYTFVFTSGPVKEYNYTIKTVEDRRVLIVDDDGKFQAIDLGKIDAEAK